MLYKQQEKEKYSYSFASPPSSADTHSGHFQFKAFAFGAGSDFHCLRTQARWYVSLTQPAYKIQNVSLIQTTKITDKVENEEGKLT